MSEDSLESLINKATSPLDNNSDEYIDKFIENLKLDPFGKKIVPRFSAYVQNCKSLWLPKNHLF